MKFTIRQHRPAPRGFTLIELSVSLVILTMMTLFGGQLYLNYTSSSRDIKAANLVYEETRFLMERIIREVRTNTIDYEEYFNRNVMIPYNGEGDYGDNYCSYSNFFYDDNGESIGTRNQTLDPLYAAAAVDGVSDAVRSVEHELYLINLSGNEKTILKRVEEDVTGNGTMTGKVAMLRMIGEDFGEDGLNGNDSYNGQQGNGLVCEPDDREQDGKIDTWLCDPDFPCIINETIDSSTLPGCQGFTHVVIDDPTDANYSFLDISPNAIDVVDLKFMIAPEDDPWKAYNIYSVQMQPHVTIQLTTRAHPVLVETNNKDRLPTITLTSTITTRNYDEVNSDCR